MNINNILNLFTILGLPERFDLDPATLERAYIVLQRATHPDRFVKASAEEKAKAAARSMDANTAYQALKSPLRRAQHLLALAGIRVGGEGDTVKPDHALLMEVMGWREALEEGEDIARRMEAEEHSCIAALSTAFSAPDMQKAAALTLRLGYIVKLNEEIRNRHSPNLRSEF